MVWRCGLREYEYLYIFPEPVFATEEEARKHNEENKIKFPKLIPENGCTFYVEASAE